MNQPNSQPNQPNQQPNQPLYDLVIVGAGPAGLAASLYASRYQVKHLLIGEEPGGQGNLAPVVENYLGFEQIAGPELVGKFLHQALSYGVELKRQTVKRVEPTEVDGQKVYAVVAADGQYLARTVILAMGASYRNLGVPGETDLIGRGVSYCTNCDAPFFRDKTVVVIGGGDAAVIGALHVAGFATKVYLVHRRQTFRAEPFRVEKLKQNPKIELILENQIKTITGHEKVEAVTLEKPYNGQSELKVDGVFIEIGHVPATVIAKDLGVEVDETNYIKINAAMETNLPGIFAAGDLAAMPGELLLRQLVTATADGAKAAAAAFHYLNKEAPSVPVWGNK